MTFIRKFGTNPDVDIADVPEDIWEVGDEYEFPTAARHTFIVSDDAADTSDGTGGRTVTVWGLDDNYAEIRETVTLNGASQVRLSNDFRRVIRARVITAGSDGVNAGNIDVLHGSTVIARISPTLGSTLLAIYTVAARFTFARIARAFFEALMPANGTATVAIQVRPFGGAWRTEEYRALRQPGNTGLAIEYSGGIFLQPKDDVRCRVLTCSVDNTQFNAGFDVEVDPNRSVGRSDL
jgi:hypothetical protein